MKSSHLSCLLGNAGLLWSQCHGIEPHLMEKEKSHCFS